jgi:hypothetical protein
MHADTQGIPGHGRLGTREDLRSYRDNLKTMRDRVAGMMASGSSLDEIQAARPTADYADEWQLDEAAERSFTETLYWSLGGR